MSRYHQTYAAWKNNPDAFWADAAGAIDWVKPWTAVSGEVDGLHQWFIGAECNTCWNAVDRHVKAGHGERLAVIYDSPITGDKAKYTYHQLLDEVATGKITGEEDEFSHTDLWDFKANIEGSQAAIAALRPVLEKADPDLVAIIDKRFAELDTELNQYQKDDGSWTFYDELTPDQIKKLSDAVAALSEPISKVASVVAQAGQA